MNGPVQVVPDKELSLLGGFDSRVLHLHSLLAPTVVHPWWDKNVESMF